jgi:ribosome recycling factor
MEELIKNFSAKTKPLLDGLANEFSSIRTNRPTPQLVEDIAVDYMEQKMKVKQLGSISVVPPREIQIHVWDPASAPAVAKAIESSPLKLSPSVEGTLIRFSMPSLTEERRLELIKFVKATAEKSRIRLRALRDDVNKEIEAAFKAKTLSEDQKFKSKKQIQDVVDKLNRDIEVLVAKKTAEIAE